MTRETDLPPCPIHDEKVAPVYKRKGTPQKYSRLVKDKVCHSCLKKLIKKNKGELI